MNCVRKLTMVFICSQCSSFKSSTPFLSTSKTANTSTMSSEFHDPPINIKQEPLAQALSPDLLDDSSVNMVSTVLYILYFFRPNYTCIKCDYAYLIVLVGRQLFTIFY